MVQSKFNLDVWFNSNNFYYFEIYMHIDDVIFVVFFICMHRISLLFSWHMHSPIFLFVMFRSVLLFVRRV